MAQNRVPLLSLDTLAPVRPFINIDGESYELAVKSDFGIVQSHRLAQLQAPMAAYNTDGDLTDDDAVAMAGAVREFVSLIVRGSTPALLDQLTEAQMLQIIEVFTEAASLRRENEAAADPPPPQTMENSYPDFNISTEGILNDG
jgi:hypothetical protein